MRTRVLLLAAGLSAYALCALSGCGGAATTAQAAREPLGVQSNGGASRVTLRLSPSGPMTFATELSVSLASEMLGEPMTAQLESRGIRRVIEVRPDRSVSMEEIETATSYTVTMMGNTQTGPETAAGPSEPDRYVLGDRGRRTDEVIGGPGAMAPTPPPSDFESEMQRRFEGALDPLVRALEFPAQPVSPTDTWSADGVIAFADVDPSMGGGATYRMTQRLERLEGSGDGRTAVISFEGSLDGNATGASGRGRGTTADAGITGTIQFRGFYTVALADGFARTGRVQFDGEARIGPEAMMRFPLRGEMRWDATPIAAH